MIKAKHSSAHQLHKLPANILKIAKQGSHGDGGGLRLVVSPAGLAKWIFRYSFHGKVREAGLGSARNFSLAEARGRAASARDLLARDIDPLVREPVKATKTFGQCAAELIASKQSGWRNDKHVRQWGATILAHCKAILDRPVDQVDTEESRFGQTASRGRIPAAQWAPAVALVYGSATKEVFKGFPAATGNSNNRAELLAVILGLQALNRAAAVEIKTDSQYVADGFATWRNGERLDRKNADLFAGIEHAAAVHAIAIEWVRGGAEELNRHADFLSRRGASEFFPARTAEALRKYEAATASGKDPGPLYQWLLRYGGPASNT